MLLAGSGLVLFVLRLPLRVTKTVADLAATRFYGLFLGEMGPGCRIEFGARIESPRSVFLGRNVHIGKGTLVVSELPSSKLHVGDNVQINRSCHIDYTGGLDLGAGVLISEEAVIYTHSHGTDPRSAPRPIEKKIGKDCWIGARALVLENADHLADNTLVAAGSVLTKPVDDRGMILAGVPAKPVAKR